MAKTNKPAPTLPTTMVAVKADTQTKQTSGAIRTALGKVSDLTISSQPDLEAAIQLVSRLAEARKTAEERRKFFVKPLNDHVKEINTYFRQVTDPVDAAERAVKGKIADYRTQEAARLAKAREREEAERQTARDEELEELADALGEDLEAVREESSVEIAPIAPAAPVEMSTMHAGGAKVTMRKVWDFDVTDPNKVPVSLLRDCAHTPKGKEALATSIRSAIKAGVRRIEGVNIYEREEVAVR